MDIHADEVARQFLRWRAASTRQRTNDSHRCE
jgi:hypothetical protein